MNNVYDVFKQLQDEQIQLFAEGEETIDSNEYCMLESDTTRKILIPEKYSIFGVESDEKVKTVKFAFPRYVDDGRLDLMDYQICINYKTANPDTENNTDKTRAQNIHTVGDYIVFEWLLSRRVTQYKGTITFIVCAITPNDDGTIITEWNTTLATSESIEGLEVSPNENEEEQARDLLTELLEILNETKIQSVNEIEHTKEDAKNEITTNKNNALTAIANKGAETLESIPDDYTTLENRVDELEQNRAYVIVGNDSGEFVTLNDSSELKTRNIKLFGKSVQKTTNGYNLFDLQHFVDLINEHTEESGCSAEILDYATGTFKIIHPRIEYKKYISLGFTTDSAFKNLQKTKVYYSSVNNDITSSGQLFICAQIGTTSFSKIFGNTSYTFLNGNDVVLYNQRNIITGTETIYKGLFLANTYSDKNSLNENYEVFTNGIAQENPTPDYPLPITSAGNYDAEEEKYEIGILVANKNFASNVNVYSGYYADLSAKPSSEDSRFIRVSKIKIIPGVTYKLSSNLIFYSIWSYDVNDNPIIRKSYSSSNTVLLNATDEEIYIGISLQNTSGQADTTAFKFIQVEAGEEQTSYIDGKSQNTTLQIPSPLRGVPVDSGGNYTDVKGQKFLGDIADKQKSKIYRGCGSKTFNGSETWYANTSNHIYTYITSDAKIYPSNALCDSYVFKHDAVQLGQSDFGFAIVSPYYIQFKNVNVQSIDDWKNMLQTRPITIVYPLATPTEETLTPDQLSALNLSTYEGVTNIGTDTMPQVGIDVEYIADTKNYIDNAIAEAIAAIPIE